MNFENLKVDDVFNLDLTADEIEFILDKFGSIDQVIDRIKIAYKNQLSNLEFKRIRNIINLLDLTRFEELQIASKLSDAAKRNFSRLMNKGKLSRLEIIYYIKNNLATDEEIVSAFKSYKSSDFVGIILHWKPYLFENELIEHCKQYRITKSMINSAKKQQSNFDKFRYILN